MRTFAPTTISRVEVTGALAGVACALREEKPDGGPEPDPRARRAAAAGRGAGGAGRAAAAPGLSAALANAPGRG